MNTIKPVIVAVFIIVLFTASAQSGPVVFKRSDYVDLSETQIDRTVKDLMHEAEVVGLGLALISDGRIAYVNSYGYATLETRTPLGLDTIMYGASFTKSVFAYLVMMLVDEGLVDLDKPIADYLPKPLPAYEDWSDLRGDERWRAWTLRSLLSHQSGLWNWRWIHPQKKLEILFEPGSRYAYSGEGMQVAQFVLEQGLGLDVGALMQEHIFDRFGMSRTSMTWREDFRQDFARGHDKEGNNLGHHLRENVRVAGSMDTTISDFARFMAGVSTGQGLSEHAMAEMISPQVKITSKRQFPTQFPEDTNENEAINLSYGLGWGLFQSHFGPAFFKEGHDDGWNNYTLCLVETSRCIVIMANSSNAESIFLYLVDALMGETGLPWEWEGYVPYDHHQVSGR